VTCQTDLRQATGNNFSYRLIIIQEIIMALSNMASTDEFRPTRPVPNISPDERRGHASAVSWGAIIAGAAAAAALSLIMLILGTGLGLSSVSPWANNGIDAKTFGVSTILWLTLTQLVASGMGGYLAGRLRSRWVAAHTDEIYFRDTAHGFLAWAVASLATAALLTSVVGSIISSGVQAGATVAGGVASTTVAAAAGGAAANGTTMTKSDRDSGPLGYFLDSMFRKDTTTNAPGSSQRNMSMSESAGATGNAEPSSAASLAEVARIFTNSIQNGPLPADDVHYVGQVVAQRTGVSQQEAEKRVLDTYARIQTKLHEMEASAKEMGDKTRKASAYTALWLFISLLIGAFVASLSAVYGGRQRDL
jgi:hypothetical protein